jgi:hypothetical protein
MNPEDLKPGEWYFFAAKDRGLPKVLFKLKEVREGEAAYNPLLKPAAIIEVHDNGILVRLKGFMPDYNSVTILKRMMKWTDMPTEVKREIVQKLFYKATTLKV